MKKAIKITLISYFLIMGPYHLGQLFYTIFHVKHNTDYFVDTIAKLITGFILGAIIYFIIVILIEIFKELYNFFNKN